MAFTDFIPSFESRTAGLERFNRPSPQSIDKKSPINKFLDFATEAFNPGHVQQNEEAAAAPNAIQQFAQQQTDEPFRDTVLGNVAEIFVPGVRNIFDRQRATPKQTENQRQASLLMGRGLSRTDAENIAEGFVKPITDPVTGQTELVDLTTGESKPLSIPEKTPSTTDEIIDPLQQFEPPKVPSLFERAPLSTGVVSAAKDVFSGTLGQIPGVPIAEQTVQARQDLRTAQQDLVKSLIIDKFSVGQMEAIKEEVDIESSVLGSPKKLQQKMISIDRSLRNKLIKLKKSANDRALPAEARKNAATNANSIENFLDTLSVPIAVKTPEDARKLPSGSTFIDPSGKIRRVP